MDEPPSPLLKSRIPRKTIIVDNIESIFGGPRIYDVHCPVQKGIIYYRLDGVIFEHNIHFSAKYEPRIIVPEHPSRYLGKISFIPIKGNRILLFAKYVKNNPKTYLHLSIHEIRSDNRVGPTLWSFDGDVHSRFDLYNFVPIKSTENALGITFGEQFNDHWKMFDICTTDTDASDNFPLIESGRIDFGLKFKSESLGLGILSPDRRILLKADSSQQRDYETIDINYSDSGDTNNINFSSITRMSIPIPRDPEDIIDLEEPELAFSADGSKFAMNNGRVSVWDIRSKVPLKTFTGVPKSNYDDGFVQFLQFSSGKLGKEVLVFVVRDDVSHLEIIHVIDATSFETEEMLPLKLKRIDWDAGVGGLFFDPSGGTLYAELEGTLYEWDLQENKPGPEWWIGEE
ncbi:hypothetical protein K443DRAFT_686667 [Laccaria amethystina LaAM-08-1]|uniref:Methanethiol oxidase n=1 Tax=Laccaria amethystina LaAM-08-1 TaxID=1095629 RepID=A0A0C9WLT7_9AGAR|nr:hypothetical protein K443DRAFT_686667 [Laccaria amethystina LaAM-08-1]